MKRIGFLYDKICSVANLIEADNKARKGKGRTKGILKHDAQRGANILTLHNALMNGEYRTSEYSTFKVYEHKERIVYNLPHYPDRIVHHAIMNYLEDIFVSVFTNDSYASIKGRGTHKAVDNLKNDLRDHNATQFYVKMDITKFYPSIDHDIVKAQLRRKIKDARLLALLDEIIDSAEGLPIGNYLSQYLSNLYLSGLDHWLKEQKGVKHYYRYADDMLILGATKAELHALRAEIMAYLRNNLKLEMKGNYRVAPSATGIDYLGYVVYPKYTMLRKRNKQAFARTLKRNASRSTIASYVGMAKHCNSRHLLKTFKLTHEQIQRPKHRTR